MKAYLILEDGTVFAGEKHLEAQEKLSAKLYLIRQ